jgi:DNA-binding MarR family transcriptional regulator
MDWMRSFGFLVKDVARLSAKNFERHAAELNLTLNQCRVLITLERHQGISQIGLAEMTDIDPMTLMRILDRMERDDWVQRQPDPADRRARKLFLGEAAAPIIKRMWQIADQARDESLAGMSAADRDQLINLLTRLWNTLDALVSSPAGPSTTPQPTEKEQSMKALQ